MTMPNESGLPEVARVFAQTAAGGVLSAALPSGALALLSVNGTGTAPAVAAGTGAGVGATIGTQKGHDLGGSFVLTTAGTPAAGTLATITFGTPLAAAPASVIVTCWDNTGAAAVAVGYSATGTAITVLGPTTTTAHALLVSYAVVAS